MKNYKYRFISSKHLFAICIADIAFFSAAFIGIAFFALWSKMPFLLMGDFIILICLALGFALLLKEVYLVKVYDDKITFKALWQKEKILSVSEIKNIYEYFMLKMGNFYLFGTQDVTIDKISIVDSELPEKELLRFGYPFKIAVNEKTTKIIRGFWEKPIIQVKL